MCASCLAELNFLNAFSHVGQTSLAPSTYLLACPLGESPCLGPYPSTVLPPQPPCLLTLSQSSGLLTERLRLIFSILFQSEGHRQCGSIFGLSSEVVVVKEKWRETGLDETGESLLNSNHYQQFVTSQQLSRWCLCSSENQDVLKFFKGYDAPLLKAILVQLLSNSCFPVQPTDWVAGSCART